MGKRKARKRGKYYASMQDRIKCDEPGCGATFPILELCHAHKFTKHNQRAELPDGWRHCFICAVYNGRPPARAATCTIDEPICGLKNCVFLRDDWKYWDSSIGLNFRISTARALRHVVTMQRLTEQRERLYHRGRSV